MLRLIGAGSYGEVWLARNTAVGTARAIKVVYRKRFKNDIPYAREFSGIQKFEPVSRDHEGFVDILQIGRNDELGYFYYIMELADDAGGDGRALSTPGQSAPSTIVPDSYCPRTLALDLLRRGRLPVLECVQRGITLSMALEYLHGLELVHRDIKPSNVVFIGGIPKLADIGTVAEAGAAGSLVGTEGFMAPEGPGSPLADIYSLGKVLYELSTNKESAQCPNPPTNLAEFSDHRKWLELNEVVGRACNPNPLRRYPSAVELRGDLALLLAGKSILRIRQRERMQKLFLAAVALVLLISIGWGGLQRLLTTRAERIRQALLREAQLARAGPRVAGWTAEHANRLERAARIGVDADLRDQAIAGLAGIDMRQVAELGGSSSSVTFDQAGNVWFGGVSGSRNQRTTNETARFWANGSNHLEISPCSGDGPVGLFAQGQPVQFVATKPGRFALRMLRTGEVIHEFSLAGNPTTGYNGHAVLAMTSDATKVAAAVAVSNNTTDTGRFAVWDAGTGRELGQREMRATAMAFSPDGTLLATGELQGRAVLWTLPLVGEPQILQSGRGEIESLAFGPDQHAASSGVTNAFPWLLAVGDNTATIRIFEIATKALRTKCLGSSLECLSLAFSPDGTLLASGGREAIHIWDATTGGRLLLNSGHSKLSFFDNTRALAFSPDGHRIAVANQSMWSPSALSVWDFDEGRGIRSLHGLTSQARKLWWSPNGRRLAALADDWELAVWEMPGGRLTHVVDMAIGASPDNAALVFHPDGSRIAFAAGRDACLYDLAAHRMMRSWQFPLGFADALEFNGQDRLIFVHSEEDENGLRPPRMWALYELPLAPGAQGPRPIARQADTNWVTWVTALPVGGDYFLVGGGCPTNQTNSAIQAWSFHTGARLWEFPTTCAYQEFGLDLEPTATRAAFESGPYDQGTLVSLPQGTCLETMDIFPNAISPSGKYYAWVQKSGLHLSAAGHFKDGVNLAMDFGSNYPEFSPDGRYLAWATHEGPLFVADLPEVERRMREFGWSRR
jgi:WD40 repeat protein